MKIFVLYLHALKVKLYFAFMMFVLEAIGKFEVVEQMFARYVGQVRAAFEQLNRVYLKYDQKFYTEAVQEKDKGRNTAFRELNDAVRSVTLFPENEAKKQAAEILLKIISLYGGSRIVYQGMNEKSTSLVNLIEDFEQKYLQEVDILGFGRLLTALRQAQKDFEDVYMTRAEYDSQIGKGAMAEARRKMDEAYRDFVTIVNLEAKSDSEGKLTDFIRLMNVEVGKYRSYTGQGQVSGNEAEEDASETPILPPIENEPTEPSGGSGSNETPTDPTKILLLFNDGVHGNVIVKRMEVEPGYQLQASDLPDGYVYAFKADDQADIDAASPGEAVWVTLAPRD